MKIFSIYNLAFFHLSRKILLFDKFVILKYMTDNNNLYKIDAFILPNNMTTLYILDKIYIM